VLVENASERPTRVRYGVVFFGVALAVLAFVDRVAISQAAPLISADLGLSKTQMGAVFSAFLLSYGLFEVPGAWYGDLVGPRKALLRIVLGWSSFTALTGWAWNYVSMLCVRFLFGVGEAGCFPVITRSFATWLPAAERTKAQGILWTSARWGGAFTPLLVVFVLRFVSWRGSFVLFGAVGIVWALFFRAWFRDHPEDHPSVNSAERALIARSAETAAQAGQVPWGRILASRSILLLSLQYFFVSFSWYFHLTWLPTYLQEHHRLTSAQSAAYAVFPLLACGFGSLFCGFATERVNGWTGSVDRTRKIMASAGFLGAAVSLAISTAMPTVNSTMALMAVACFFNDQVVPHSWATCMSIGGQYSSSVAGTMNVMGNLAGTASSLIGGYLLERSGNNWNLFILVLAVVYGLGLLCWPFIESERTIEHA
jgi:sugar phosphate permease